MKTLQEQLTEIVVSNPRAFNWVKTGDVGDGINDSPLWESKCIFNGSLCRIMSSMYGIDVHVIREANPMTKKQFVRLWLRTVDPSTRIDELDGINKRIEEVLLQHPEWEKLRWSLVNKFDDFNWV